MSKQDAADVIERMRLHQRFAGLADNVLPGEGFGDDLITDGILIIAIERVVREILDDAANDLKTCGQLKRRVLAALGPSVAAVCGPDDADVDFMRLLYCSEACSDA